MSHTSAVVTFLGSNAAKGRQQDLPKFRIGCMPEPALSNRSPAWKARREQPEGKRRCSASGDWWGGGTSSTTSGSETHMGNSGQTLFCVGVHKRQRSMLNSAT